MTCCVCFCEMSGREEVAGAADHSGAAAHKDSGGAQRKRESVGEAAGTAEDGPGVFRGGDEETEGPSGRVTGSECQEGK